MSIARRLLRPLYEVYVDGVELDPDDPDDEELERTPQDVIDKLGFDPKDDRDDVVAETMIPHDPNNVPPHLAKTRIPPAWKDVQVNDNPDEELWVTGTDTKGRRQPIYSPAHWQRVNSEKFTRVKGLMDAYDKIQAANEQAKRDPTRREAAHALDLVMKTGLRPGSDHDTRAEQQAYGATTLEGRHVRVSPQGKVALHFIGKKGVQIHLPIQDEKLARELTRRKNRAGANGRIFNTSDAELRAHLHAIGAGFHPKDFRTAHGTKIASELVKGMAAPTNKTQYRKSVREVAKGVAEKLGNTPTVALQSYIAPEIFGDWKAGAGA